MLYLFSLALGFEFVIKSAAEDLYLGDDTKKAYYPTLTTRPFANVLKIRTSECEPKMKIFYLDNNENTKLYYDEVADKLGYHSGVTNNSEKFEISIIDFDSQVSMISQGNQCLTYSPDRRTFVKRKCDPKNPQQLFKLINIHPDILCHAEIPHHSHSCDNSCRHMYHDDHQHSEHEREFPHDHDSHTSFLERELVLKDAEINRLKLQADTCGFSSSLRDTIAEKAQLASDSMKRLFLERSRQDYNAMRAKVDFLKSAASST